MQEKNHGASGVIARFSPNEQAADAAISLNLIKRAFDDAIEYRGVAIGTRGIASAIGAAGFLVMLWGAFDVVATSNGGDGFMRIIDYCAAAAFAMVGTFVFLKAIRMEMFRPEDEPIIFDRKNRKVYRIYREGASGWLGLIKPWPKKFAEYSWDLLSAEHHATIFANYASVGRTHALIFQVMKSNVDRVVIDSFPVGNGLIMGELTTPAVWEHIRRFMEEDGPHIPSGESIKEYKKHDRLIDSFRNAKNIF